MRTSPALARAMLSPQRNARMIDHRAVTSTTIIRTTAKTFEQVGKLCRSGTACR
jgi:hypothetical protein